jgi:hypothetical protein
MAINTPEYQDAEAAAEAVADVASELNIAEDYIGDGEYAAAIANIRAQIDLLNAIIQWCSEQGAEEGS